MWLAKKQHRNTATAGALGFVFGILAVIAYLISSRVKVNHDEREESLNCPICHDITEIKTAKTGENKGKQFRVCVNYPECKGKIEVRKKAL